MLSYSYNGPIEGKHNSDVARGEDEFDTPGWLLISKQIIWSINARTSIAEFRHANKQEQTPLMKTSNFQTFIISEKTAATNQLPLFISQRTHFVLGLPQKG